MEIMKELLATAHPTGKVEWIGIAEASRAAVSSETSVELRKSAGIVGDHHCREENSSKRQVTLIQAEHLPLVAQFLKRSDVAPELLRRNIVVSGINLAALRHQRFRVGAAVLRGSGSCPPCSRMEENLGIGGYAAMLGHAGITAIVEESGAVQVGDTVAGLGFAEL